MGWRFFRAPRLVGALAAAGAVVAATSGGAAGCSGAPAASATQCVSVSTDCAATYDPAIYSTIYANILLPTCATGTGTCHTSDAAMGGLVFAEANAAYGLLVGTNGGKARVVPGDPKCSLLVERLVSTDPSFHMPPGPNSISSGDLCTIVQWIEAGAKP